MTGFISTLSLQNKLIMAILLSCTLLLFVVSGSFLTVEFFSSRAALSQELKTLASSLATTSSRSLVLQRYSDIEENLSSLRRQGNIHAAYLFDLSGTPVAEYLNQHDSELLLNAIRYDFKEVGEQLAVPGHDQMIFTKDHMSWFVPVSFEGESIGSIYLLSDIDSLYSRLGMIVYGALIAFLLLFVLAWALARWIQKPLLKPLLQLSGVMVEVGRSDDYSIRANKNSSDEVGQLVDGFNRMLTQIEQQREKLVRHTDELEETVEARTAQLQDMVVQLEHARKQADAANQAKSDFLSKMTHELRTPLIGVLGMNELLQRTPLDEQQMLLTETVQKSGADLLTLIGDVLDLSKIEAGKLELEAAPVNLFEVIEDVVCLLAPEARAKGLELFTDIPASAAWQVVADESRIRQIVTNLVGNAIKFTSAGRIVVGLGCRVKSDNRGEFSLTVTDTGAGMSVREKERVFDLFYQTDGGAGNEQRGTGLGLAIVKQLVDLMDGRVELETTKGRGSRFQVSLLLELVRKSEPNLPAELSGTSVLVCTSFSQQGKILAQRLTEFGLKVVEVATAEEGLWQLRSSCDSGRKYSLVFIDVSVHTQIGQPLYQLLRESPELQPLRTVLLGQGHDSGVTLQGQEVRLSLPLSHSGLCQAIRHSWKNLYAVPALKDAEPLNHRAGGQGQDAPHILLLGRNVAARELARIVLNKHGFRVAVAKDVNDLMTATAEGGRPFLLIDHPYAPEDELIAFLQGDGDRFTQVALLSSSSLSAAIRSLDLMCLAKPLTDEIISTHLSPLLSEISCRGESL